MKVKEPHLSRRIAALTPSSTTATGRKAKALAASGVDVVDFGLGEPDFATPDFVGRAAISAIEAGRTKYTDVAGEAALRDAIAAKYRREHEAPVSRENVIVTAGAKQAVYNVCQALFDEGDTVALFAPYWVSYPEMARLVGATPLFVPTRIESGWHPTAAALERQAGGVAGVILNSPCNPTGAVVDSEELDRILDWCVRRDAWLVFDETYDRFLYDGRRHASAATELAAHGDRIVVTGAASKTYAMTGWRLGWAVGPPPVITAMTSYQSHTTSNASSISQAAALEALTNLEESERSVAAMLAQYSERRRVMVEGLQAVGGIRCDLPEGAFYAFADVSSLYSRKGVPGSAAFCEKLLAEAHVAAVPGEAFGEDSCVRFSFATGLDRIREGVRRIGEWVA